MAKYGKAAKLILAVMPVMAMAQAPQITQQRPVVPSATAPAPAMPVAVEHNPQPAPAQPLIPASTAPVSAGHDATAAVDYHAGQLTVVADNASLSYVLKLIAAKTGAVVDVAPELQNEPVMAHLGPNSVREVLTGLLDSAHIDYIVFGTGDEPGSLQRIVVRTRRSFGQTAMAAVRPPQPRQNGSGEEVKLDPDGSSHPAPADSQLTQQQRMEEWQKTREQMRQDEIKQQAEEREKEKTQSPDPPAPENSQPQPSSPQQDNPPR